MIGYYRSPKDYVSFALGDLKELVSDEKLFMKRLKRRPERFFQRIFTRVAVGASYNKAKKVDLSLYLRIVQGNRHDSVSAVFVLSKFRELNPNLHISFACFPLLLPLTPFLLLILRLFTIIAYQKVRHFKY